MKSRDKKAINTLKKHKEKLNDLNNHSHNWYALLSDLIAKYLGEDAMLYKSAKSWYSFAKRGSSEHLETAKEIIDSTIDYIEANGIKIENSIWRRIEKLNQKVVYGSITGLIGLVFWAGIQFSEIRNIKNEHKLILENKELKEKLQSLTINPTFDIPKEETDSNAKSN